MGRFEVTYSSAVPAGVTKEKALSVLQDPEGYFKLVASYREHKALGASEGAPDKIPANIKAQAKGSHTAWTVRNEVPNPVFDSNVTTSYTTINTEDGMYYFANSPMGVTNEGHWQVKEAGGGLELCAAIFVECTTVLKPVVKGQVESATKEIGDAMLKKAQE